MDGTSREKGLAIFGEIFGEDMARVTREHMASSTAFGAKQSEWTIDFAFGEVWSRDALSRKARSCAVIGMLIAQRAYDELVYHTRTGMKNGLSRREVEEIFYTAIPYCGFPAAQNAKKAMLQAFAEMDGETDAD
ncbi:carboxymuconolactone decarboxylase family protein [Novosphingobium mangrovi (ex Huang et al. 2023)]|uniref:Carboxymuconolactone decarboxylase family protein n=1 Tax=Novosphingobium mangrovi (ex Huang et al. 2023) TaxID=2976432 RepID=A0ABT2I5W1_9SPHN|nr:carboxymuconolactone decarboxylase family protein [Novosphingobium mangrovi (ex Huang et al. 2023)]MCT2400199.1 carboxymuconolactone decarboxylase family protein [Novosphingobium mangrovi (ex Huang et al. 2023)]